jgi:NAD(P)H-dependent FMN reductase
MTSALVVSTALNPGSKTLTAARIVQWRLETDGFAVDVADLAAESLPQCDGETCYQDKNVKSMVRRVKQAALVVICFPIFNYQPNSAAKNFVEVTGEGWKDKVVSLVANGGDDRSYLASLSLANSLMTDHHCVVVPQFLHLAPAAHDASNAVVLEGTTAELFEQQMKSATHLARTWIRPGRRVVDLRSSRLSRAHQGRPLS